MLFIVSFLIIRQKAVVGLPITDKESGYDGKS